MREYDCVVSKRLIRRVMKEKGLFSTYQVRYFRNHNKKDNVNREDVGNVVDREFDNREYKEVLVSDLTYIWVAGKWQYVCFITDLFNREILGYSFGPKKDAALVYKAFMSIGISLQNITYFHTDRGSEFKNKEIDGLLKTFGIKRSLSNAGVPYDNACAESLYNKAKIEFFDRHEFKTAKELELKLFQYVHWYNHKRLHSSLDYMSPVAYKKKYLETSLH